MNVFQTHADIVDDNSSYIRSYISITAPEIQKVVKRELGRGKLWPEPLLQFNPSFEMYVSLDDLATSGILHPDIRGIFKGYKLYHHQVEATRLGTAGKDFIVTSSISSPPKLVRNF